MVLCRVVELVLLEKIYQEPLPNQLPKEIVAPENILLNPHLREIGLVLTHRDILDKLSHLLGALSRVGSDPLQEIRGEIGVLEAVMLVLDLFGIKGSELGGFAEDVRQRLRTQCGWHLGERGVGGSILDVGLFSRWFHWGFN